MTPLIAIIYAAFISLGLPDAVIGAAWPAMAPDLGSDEAAAGVISMLVTVGTVSASFLSGWLLRVAGTFRVVVGSTALTAAALLSYAFVPSFVWMMVLAVPLGLGGGAIDAALNGYVALHLSSRHMNLLHAAWGVGASLGPLIVGFWLHFEGQWRPAYVTIALVQTVLLLVLISSRGLWRADKKARTTAGELAGERTTPGELADGAQLAASAQPTDSVQLAGSATPAPSAQLASSATPATPSACFVPGFRTSLVGFFMYSGYELTVGLWTATFLVHHHGFGMDVAAAGAAAFYGGLTGSRVISGVISERVSNQQFLTYAPVVVMLGALTLLVPGSDVLAVVGMALLGIGSGPIFPMMLQETTRRFGSHNTQRLMGIQMGTAYSSTLIVPLLVGLGMTRVSPAVLPVVVLAMVAVMMVSIALVDRMVRRREAQDPAQG
ncbi:MAG: MFS transporter [Actinomycetaceae bacterium]|nr:MFS transporter [Actinomycetaceae bacterium]